jgi:hypothetical protein
VETLRTSRAQALFLYAAELAEVDPESPKYAVVSCCFKDFDLALDTS